MKIKTQKFERKPFFVDAVRVTKENFEAVAEWCQGEVRNTKDDIVTSKNVNAAKVDIDYIQVRVLRPLDERQTRAFIGDWVLYAGTGYKVYNNGAFLKHFNRVTKKRTSKPPVKEVEVIHIDEDGEAVERVKNLIDDVDYRDARSGQYVEKEFAEEHPEVTVKETRSIAQQQADFARGQIATPNEMRRDASL